MTGASILGDERAARIVSCLTEKHYILSIFKIVDKSTVFYSHKKLIERSRVCLTFTESETKSSFRYLNPGHPTLF